MTTRLAAVAIGLSLGLCNVFPAHAADQVDAAGVEPESAGSAPGNAKQSNADQLQEIVVTAEKRVERLQDVPVPVTAISADALVSANLVSLQDYFSQVPGLQFTPTNLVASSLVSIRGLSFGSYLNPTVGFTIDDVPVGPFTANAGSVTPPDLDPSDLQRIEVLRGPQGTLYGASSMGGLIKYITVDPSTNGVGGQLQAGTSAVYNGIEAGYNFRAAINLPLSDTAALRASGFTRGDPGYIDDPLLGLTGIGETKAYGGHLAGLWKPSEIFSLKLGAIYQRTTQYGALFADFALGDLEQTRIPGTGLTDVKYQAYSAIATLRLGAAELTSVTGYSVLKSQYNADQTQVFGFLSEAFFNVSGAIGQGSWDTNKFTEEFRIAAPLGSKLELLAGAFYADENAYPVQTVDAAEPATGDRVGTLVNLLLYPNTYKEFAGFADLTFKVTERFDVQVGGREDLIEQTFTQVGSGAVFGNSTVVTPTPPANTNAFTYLLSPRFKISPDSMIYARLASGFRAGGGNPYAGPGTPPLYEPDHTRNYEVGFKASFLDHLFDVDASVYYIDWLNIQLGESNPNTGIAYTVNAPSAKSEGVELSLEAKPVRGLTLSGWIALNNAELTSTLPVASNLYGQSGDRLPFTTRFSGNFSIEEQVTVAAETQAFARVLISYQGNRLGDFNVLATPERQLYGGYAQENLSIGVHRGDWTVTAFVNNISDRRAPVYGGLAEVPQYSFQYITPRSGGLNVVKRF